MLCTYFDKEISLGKKTVDRREDWGVTRLRGVLNSKGHIGGSKKGQRVSYDIECKAKKRFFEEDHKNEDL